MVSDSPPLPSFRPFPHCHIFCVATSKLQEASPAIDLAFAFDRLEPSKQRPPARQPIYFRYEKWPGPAEMFAISSRNARLGGSLWSASLRFGPHLFLCRGRVGQSFGLKK